MGQTINMFTLHYFVKETLTSLIVISFLAYGLVLIKEKGRAISGSPFISLMKY